MGVSVGDLDPRQIERLRGELLLVLVTQCAYPPFFEYRAGKRRQRPPDRATVDETRQFLSSANFAPLHNADVTSPDVRRFLERLILRYVEVNPHLHGLRAQRRVPELRTRVPRLAAEVQRALVAYVQGSYSEFGTRRPQASWQQTSTKSRPMPADALAHSTRLLEAALMRTADTARQAIARSAPGARPAVKLGQSGIYADATVAVRAPDLAAGAHAPFADLGSGRQSAIFGRGVADVPTGPLRVQPPAARAAPAPSPTRGRVAEPVSDDLYRLYGDYLRDMQPEATAPAPAVNGRHAGAGRAGQAMPAASGPGVVSRPGLDAAAASGAAGADLHIFFQLRYQLEAYVRRAVRSYGVQQANDDPYALLDALRRSGFVDESDLRIAEGILALADRVTSAHTATLDDYRQAMTLYLLYHRSHLGD